MTGGRGGVGDMGRHRLENQSSVSTGSGPTPTDCSAARGVGRRPTEAGIAVFVLLLAGYALIANRLDQASIGPAVFFVLVGLLLGPDVLGVLNIDIESSTIRELAELTLALVLFTDASTIDLRRAPPRRRPRRSTAGDRAPPDDRRRRARRLARLSGAAGGDGAAHRGDPRPDRRCPRAARRREPGRPDSDPARPQRRKRSQRRHRDAVRRSLHLARDRHRWHGGHPPRRGARGDRDRDRRRRLGGWRRRPACSSRPTGGG